jgi:hypothetical protein
MMFPFGFSWNHIPIKPRGPIKKMSHFRPIYLKVASERVWERERERGRERERERERERQRKGEREKEKPYPRKGWRLVHPP